jgi:epoxyqueuosine reductase
VISPEIGSWLFLGVIICSLDLQVDAPALDQCGTCTLCLEACPTQAIVAPGELDARRCLSYLTIELRGDLEIPAELQRAVGSHVYGCDICQEVCPWNSSAPRSMDPAWQPHAAWDRVDLLTLARRSDAELEDALAGTAMTRAKARGLRRNITVAMRNAEEADSRRR